MSPADAPTAATRLTAGEALGAAGPIYKVLGYASLGLSTLYALGFLIALLTQLG